MCPTAGLQQAVILFICTADQIVTFTEYLIHLLFGWYGSNQVSRYDIAHSICDQTNKTLS